MDLDEPCPECGEDIVDIQENGFISCNNCEWSYWLSLKDLPKYETKEMTIPEFQELMKGKIVPTKIDLPKD